MSTIYTQPTVSSVYVGPTGHTHSKADPASGKPFAIDCGACEAYLIREGWVYDVELVPPTDQQLREQERIEREGNLAVKQAAEALATAATAQLTSSTTKAPRKTRTSTRRTATKTG